jgi:hypothetical protein
VQQPYDQKGDPWAAGALDITPGSSSWMKTMTQNMIDETKAHGDTGLLYGAREFFGTTDGYSVTGMDVPGQYWITSDDSHLWHEHISGKRQYANDNRAWAQIAQCLTGTVTDDEGFLMALSDAQQTDLYNDVEWIKARIAGMLPQRYYTVDEQGVAHSVPAGTKGAAAAHALDTLDGNSIQRNVDAVGNLIPQRYYTVDEQGVAHSVPKGTAGAHAAHILDTLDGNSIQQSIRVLQEQLDTLTE